MNIFRTPPKTARPTPAPLASSPLIADFKARVSRASPVELAQLAEQFWAEQSGPWPLLEPAADRPAEPAASNSSPSLDACDRDNAGGANGEGKSGLREWIVTFLWRDAHAEEVLLFANRLTDEKNLPASLMQRVPGTDTWHLSYRMRSDWRASYSFLPRYPGQPWPWGDGGQVSIRAALDSGRPDPRNPLMNRNRSGQVQSVVALPDAPAQDWLARRPGLPTRGQVSVHSGPTERQVWVYDPPGVLEPEPTASGELDIQALDTAPSRRSLPVVVLLDGEVWNGPQDAAVTLDNLLADGLIRPCRVLMPHSGGRGQRWAEMDGTGDGARWIAQELLPWARGRFPVSADPAGTMVAGQSLGGLTALRSVLEHPGSVGMALAQSASLWQADLAKAVAGQDLSELRAYIEVGTQEWILREPNARLAAAMAAAGAEVRFEEYNGGHDYACWRGGLADGLRTLLPPPI
ncbi:MAG: DUF3327 domain-containing protein [Bifidobacteriaceae bacterium]|nr:DUF3327 domain-containing protein [Bifidobacteriaceae bacterium]